jgi:hypothetical protein
LELDTVEDSLDILTAFFIETQRNRHQLLILPQIPDWAWHEFILLSNQYALFTSNVYGGYLPHMKIVRDEDSWEESKRIFHREYAFDTHRTIWQESGWDSPAYGFREDWRTNIAQIERTINQIHGQHNGHSNYWEAKIPVDLSWLHQRISERFLVSEATAKFSVHTYIEYLSSVRAGADERLDRIPSVVLWAWQEHMLWTEKYKNDCFTLFGEFLDRPLVPAALLFSIFGG